MPFTHGGTEFVWSASRKIYRRTMHGLRHLFLRLSRTRRHYCLSLDGSQATKFFLWRPPMRQLCKGNVAVVKGALLAGCRSYYGYPITPASEIAEPAAEYLPQRGGTFLQAESEVAAINMVYGAASAGQRGATVSSGAGFTIMEADTY